MALSVADGVDFGLLVVLGYLAWKRKGPFVPPRWRAYRWLRRIPTRACLVAAALGALSIAVIILVTPRWQYAGTSARLLFDIALKLALIPPMVPAARLLIVPGRPAEKRKGFPAEYQVTFERNSATEVGLHVRRTDGYLSVLRQRLPSRVANLSLAVNAVLDHRASLLACGVRYVRVTSPDLSAKAMAHLARHMGAVLGSSSGEGALSWEPVPPRPLSRWKRVVVRALRAREPLRSLVGAWTFVLFSVAGVVWPPAWVRAVRGMRRIWVASAEPLVERGVRITL
ncbi:hypothetical protein RHOFW510R12_00430 [Rhodanobacter sp. FW510-R12]